jgi:hypothetical protein
VECCVVVEGRAVEVIGYITHITYHITWNIYQISHIK